MRRRQIWSLTPSLHEGRSSSASVLLCIPLPFHCLSVACACIVFNAECFGCHVAISVSEFSQQHDQKQTMHVAVGFGTVADYLEGRVAAQLNKADAAV